MRLSRLFQAVTVVFLCFLMLPAIVSCNKEEEKSEMGEEKMIYTSATKSESPLRPNGLFCENMVLQQGRSVPVWGAADAELEGKEITLTFAGQTKTTTVKDGAWRVDLDALEASFEGKTMLLTCGEITYRIDKVRVGEVLLASGQSNMCFYIEYLTGETKNEILANSNQPNLGFFIVPEDFGTKTKTDVSGSWVVPSASNIQSSKISTVAFLTAAAMQKELNVPVGVVVSAYGGSRIESWIDPKVLLETEKAGTPVFGGVTGEGTYKGMIAPLQPFAFRAMIFYQGEANCFPNDHVPYYPTYVKAMVESYRTAFENPGMPFLQVSLPSYDLDLDFTGIRNAQISCDSLIDRCWTTVNYDTGNAKDIHPADKSLVGKRLADLVLQQVYGKQKDQIYPTAISAEATEDGALITFETGTDGLAVTTSEICSLEVAGEDGVYYPATGVLVGENRLRVYCPSVKTVKQVRYGYASNLLACNFYGANGLPVKPFLLPVFVQV
ncbi:MAG: hypothetical protein IJC85_00740 [Oscillospiraceae bacterium]|nr:hypothetical protein [Oscillospiraceae bacterium]